jgi:hypothetical protein
LIRNHRNNFNFSARLKVRIYTPSLIHLFRSECVLKPHVYNVDSKAGGPATTPIDSITGLPVL